jgi:uncharacterized protein
MYPWRVDGGDWLVQVRLTPRSAKDAIGGIWTDEKDTLWLCAQVRSVPEKGKANAALIQLMAKALSVPQRYVTLEAGDTSRLKRIRISGASSEIETRLLKVLEQ